MKFKIRILPFALVLLGFCLLFENSCKKKKEALPPSETGTVTDVVGNVYKTVKIGNQWWMAENLKTTKYRNGKYIPFISASMNTTAWDSTQSGACCYFNNDFAAPGLLYNWYVVSDTNNIAPAGWHVPKDDEWKTLEKYLGMSQADADNVNWRGTNEGDELKIAATQGGWAAYSTLWATNESGFTARAGGCRMFNSTETGSSWSAPLDLKSTGFWWTSDVHSGDKAWYRYLDYKNSNVFRYYGPKTYGFSIRCVKD